MGERERLLAHYYELEYAEYVEDVEFYVQYATALDPERALPVLELGCGTGRIAVALALAGFRVVGVDSSPEMLQVCDGKARAAGVQDKVTLVAADMRDLPALPPGPYNFAFCALNTFAYLLSTEEQLAVLGAVREALVQHGILVLDLTAPRADLLPPSSGEIVHQGTYPDSDGSWVHKSLTGVEEPSAQTHHVTLLYDREGADGSLTRTSQSLRMRWTGRYEMELLLRLAGYALEKTYGSYGLDEYGDESPRMIFVART
jgi:SAM-dependent methyltransferase